MKNALKLTQQQDRALKTNIFIRVIGGTAATALAVLLLDQGAKWFFSHGTVFTVIPSWFSLRVFYNPGIVFGFSLHASVLAFLMIAAFLLISRLFIQEILKGSRQASICYGLLIGGALSNVIDRVRVGAVIDYIEIAHLSVLNLADLAIALGLLGFFLIQRRVVARSEQK